MSAPNEDFQPTGQPPGFQPPPPPITPESKPAAPRPTKLRPFAIAFFVLGLLVLGAGIPKIIAGGISTGVVLCIFGILLFAFSFIPLPVIPDAEPPLSFFEKLTGIFVEPTRVFRNLRAHPHWLGAFVVVVVLTIIYSFAFVQRITPERIVEHITSKMAEMPAPLTPPPEVIERSKTDQLSAFKNPAERAGGVVKQIVGLFVLGSFAAALCLLALLAFGGRINFWQALAVVFYSWLPVTIIQKVLGLGILYLKAPEDLHPILNQETTLQDNLSILVASSEHPVLYVMLSFIGLTWFYLVWLRAKGLNQGGTRVSSGAGWGVSIMLYVLLLLAVTVWTSLFSSFVT